MLELNQAWTYGFSLPTYYQNIVNIKLALACISCDVPATRKVCGFLGHNASFGCNKCLKKFHSSFGERTDYSGFDRENWTMRTVEQHRKQLDHIATKCTKTTSIQEEQSKYGVKYSVLLSLPYLDPIRFIAIDVMHNLFLGTGKHMMDVWIHHNVLTKDDLLSFEKLIDKFHSPADIGHIPSNVSAGYGGFTANQWRLWITLYSPVVLKSVLPREHYQCWLLYVRVCAILCSQFLHVPDVDSADLFLLNFCRRCEALYGPDVCTANFHLHLQSILDFGPSHSFWCFAFVRFNGILGSYHTNNRAIEVMRRFYQEQAVHEFEIPPQTSALFNKSTVLSKRKEMSDSTVCAATFEMYLLVRKPLTGTTCNCFYNVIVLPPFQQKILSSDLLEDLKFFYKKLYPNMLFPQVSPFYDHYGCILLAGDVIGSTMPGPNNSASSVIMAFWPNSDSIDYSRMQVGVVQYFLKHTTTLASDTESNEVQHILAYIKWKEQHPQFNWFGVSATVCVDTFTSQSPSNFLPVQCIACRCAYAKIPVTFETNYTETVFVASPFPIRYCM